MYLNFSVIKPLINWKIIPTIISFQSNDVGTQKTSETHPMLATESAAVVGDTSSLGETRRENFIFRPAACTGLHGHITFCSLCNLSFHKVSDCGSPIQG